ncbi:Heme-degrading monooxygenase HmoA [Poseidonocella pacifica]|uniref:Heme-degrading monooxygenase HmoA n=1 Tax=Poseidonocella pacifica TaxID=871651 RepID=A0A1I0VQL9_9RHOB|nr:antibiotic biosynthesis monooxygenase [Poseidonocella pacifica]SFA78641.1 Heme-degrading monooxygenase HmoA [Poseidonocella pacifica]
MLAVIFEVWPADGQREDYLALAASLRADLHQMDGFLGVERFESLTEPGKLLSLSFWRDEEALAAWRALPRHRAAQTAGRDRMFHDYRLRVAGVIRDYGLADRAEAPQDSQAAHCPGGKAPL